MCLCDHCLATLSQELKSLKWNLCVRSITFFNSINHHKWLVNYAKSIQQAWAMTIMLFYYLMARRQWVCVCVCLCGAAVCIECTRMKWIIFPYGFIFAIIKGNAVVFILIPSAWIILSFLHEILSLNRFQTIFIDTLPKRKPIHSLPFFFTFSACSIKKSVPNCITNVR